MQVRALPGATLTISNLRRGQEAHCRSDSAIFEVKQESKISVQIHEAEINWGGFLVDEDCFPLLPFWERKKKAMPRTDQGVV